MKKFYNGHNNLKIDECLLNDAYYGYENDFSANLSSPVSTTSKNETTAEISSPLNSLPFDKNLLEKRNALQINDSSGYDTLRKPFKHEPHRGRWSATADFYFACTSHGFGVNIFSETGVISLFCIRGAFLPVYLLTLLFQVVPIFIIQTFLGQFSSTGAISAFRVAPLFKGIGYAILLLNSVMLGYCAFSTALPLLYAVYSFQSELPWMSCNNPWNSQNCSTHTSYNESELFLPDHSVIEFFRFILRSGHEESQDFSFNWLLGYGIVGIWTLILLISLQNIAFLGKFLRFVCITMILTFTVIFIRLCIHEGSAILDIFSSFIEPMFIKEYRMLPSALFIAQWPLGLCLGNVLTMASYNHFRRDSEKWTYWIVGSQAVLTLMATICGTIAVNHFEDEVGLLRYHYDEDHILASIYLHYPHLLGRKEMPNMWSGLFFGMLFFAELCGMIVQMKTVLTALFDEFECFRTRKTRITIFLVMLLSSYSLIFCTKVGVQYGADLPYVATVTNVTIALPLILMCTWIYGRQRFQCDMQFMLGKTISNFKLFLIRFWTPFFLGFIIIQIFSFMEIDVVRLPQGIGILPYLAGIIVIGVYMLLKVLYYAASRHSRERMNRLYKPQDWYPRDSDNRRFYEEIMGISEMTVLSPNEI